MDTILWITQGFLAFSFLMAGFMKLTKQKEELADKMAFVEDFSASTVRLIGALEVLAAIGLILPWLLNIVPQLTALAAVGLILVMIGAIITHIRRKESSMLVVNFALLLMAGFVVWGRFVA